MNPNHVRVNGRPNWREGGTHRWVDVLRFIPVSGDPEDYSSAREVAASVGHAVAAGPFLFYPDGTHVVAAGWEKQPDGRYPKKDPAAYETEQATLWSEGACTS